MVTVTSRGVLGVFRKVLPLLLVLPLALTGCGGGGAKAPDGTTAGGSGTTTPGSGGSAPGGTTASRLELLTETPTIESSGRVTVNVTAVALDNQNRTIANKSVSFQVTDPNGTAFLSVQNGGLTDGDGRVSATLSVGSNKGNRKLTLAASSDGTSKSTDVDVTGTSVALSGTTSLPFGGSAQLSIRVKDSAGVAIASVPVTVTSARGNSFSPTSVVTDSAGEAIVTVNANVSGSDTVTVSAQGAAATSPLVVSSANFTFVSPSPVNNADVTVNTNQSITIHWDESGVPQAGQTINFAATRGTITCAAPCQTNGSGNVTAVVSSATTGFSTITASGPGGVPSNTLNLTFITTTASSLTLQTDKSTVPVNTAGSTTNRATITAVLRDAANNLVKDGRVVFSIVKGGQIGGQLTSGVDTTDVNGIASVDYIAGTTSSAQNGVEILAHVTDVNGAAVSVPDVKVQLTVGGQSLFIRLETDNSIEEAAPTYKKTYTAIVTDAAGNGVSGATVQFILRPRQDDDSDASNSSMPAYYKGVRVFSSGAWRPVYSVSVLGVPTGCDNEDSNFNGFLDPSEDFNTSGDLTPGNVASATSNVVTNSGGFANTVIQYAQNFADWAAVTLEARVTVAGTEAVATRSFILPVLASDVNNQNTQPPGQTSPFGTATACINKD